MTAQGCPGSYSETSFCYVFETKTSTIVDLFIEKALSLVIFDRNK